MKYHVVFLLSLKIYSHLSCNFSTTFCIFVVENRNPCVFISITAGGDAARFQGYPWRQLRRGDIGRGNSPYFKSSSLRTTIFTYKPLSFWMSHLSSNLWFPSSSLWNFSKVPSAYSLIMWLTNSSPPFFNHTGRAYTTADSTSKCKFTTFFCKSTLLVLRNWVFPLVLC